MTDTSYGTHHSRTTERDATTAELDSTAGLLTMISTQLGNQLSNRRPLRERPRPPALVLVAHGSRNPGALATVTELVADISELRPELTVRLGHIELNAPLLGDTLAALPAGRAVLVPLLLSRGHHVKRDIPAAAAAAGHLSTVVAAPLGPHPLLVDALHDRLTAAGWPEGPLPEHERRRTGVVLAAAGSRDPQAAVDTRRTADLLARRLGVPVVPGYASAAAPDVATAVRALSARGRTRIAVASYFTAPGRFADESAAALATGRGIAAAPLGTHPAMARLVLHRYDSALAAPGTAFTPHLATA
ncbi:MULTISPECIES: sirohydrochlorin chelatase [unclassified Streptomyces]|uniref:sirohydrochlorin chelatase n=1 Tax=unclassified Streptomyces TaxID=2593676 RepID=UPI000DB92939|nr:MULTISPECIES: sirohydrochlorin chelatase [unclassified Streptomyces]MYT73172.1 sirohydrochlorin chelatase [Streptomyces sp. SID8367]RAJ73634.1 sirohydrochlorin ferrochelatase [Streptomyces sp. PsTaAH-137]